MITVKYHGRIMYWTIIWARKHVYNEMSWTTKYGLDIIRSKSLFIEFNFYSVNVLIKKNQTYVVCFLSNPLHEARSISAISWKIYDAKRYYYLIYIHFYWYAHNSKTMKTPFLLFFFNLVYPPKLPIPPLLLKDIPQ